MAKKKDYILTENLRGSFKKYPPEKYPSENNKKNIVQAYRQYSDIRRGEKLNSTEWESVYKHGKELETIVKDILRLECKGKTSIKSKRPLEAKKGKRKKPAITLLINGIPIKIQAETWNQFKWAFLLKPDDFMKQLNDRIVDKVAEDEEKLKPLWGNRKKAEVIKWLKSEAGELYLIFSQLCAMLLKETPLWFQRLIKESKLTDPELLTAFCILKAYPQGLEENDLEKHFDVYAKSYNKKDLRRTYLAVTPEGIKKEMLRRLSNARRNGAAEYLRKKKIKQPHAYSDILAMRDDMYPCDKAGNLLEQVQGKIRKSLIEEIFRPSDNFTLKKIIKP